MLQADQTVWKEANTSQAIVVEKSSPTCEIKQRWISAPAGSHKILHTPAGNPDFRIYRINSKDQFFASSQSMFMSSETAF